MFVKSFYVEKYYSIQNIRHLAVKDSTTPKIDDFYWLIEQMIKWDKLHQNLLI